jgi:hypothetical protein
MLIFVDLSIVSFGLLDVKGHGYNLFYPVTWPPTPENSHAMRNWSSYIIYHLLIFHKSSTKQGCGISQSYKYLNTQKLRNACKNGYYMQEKNVCRIFQKRKQNNNNSRVTSMPDRICMKWGTSLCYHCLERIGICYLYLFS